MALGFGIWIAGFSLLYAVQATGCEFAWQQVRLLGQITALHALLYGLFAAHMAGLLWLLAHCRRKLATTANGTSGAFLWQASACLTLAAIAALIWIGMALPLPSACR